MFKHIVLASDGSEHALRAADKTIELIGHFPEAKVDVLYSVDGATAKTDVLHSPHLDGCTVQQQRKEKMQSTEAVLKEANIEYDLHIIHGEPGPSIIKFADDHHVDLIVMGSRGLNALQEVVLGSVSHKVAQNAKCPVMIVK